MEIDTATGQLSLLSTEKSYENFVEKFKTAKTTDDCYTPDAVHQAVTEWVAKEYALDPQDFIRPFWPGADYKATEYPAGCVVVDNPPFSIRNQIVDFYLEKEIRFFLYSPALTLLTNRKICHIATGAPIIYANGADVTTSFVTNLESCAIRTAPELYQAIKKAVEEGKATKTPPKYTYPDHVVTAAIVQRWCHYGIEYGVGWEECTAIDALDAQREKKKKIFGRGLLLSERAAAERAAAERAAAERAAEERAAATQWQLSEREKEIVQALGKR